ncbi:Glycosyl hydrolase family 43, five-bladed beta-propellor domain protein [Moelleriella libera RCEF 2490]|uniref:Glycosyl hydrolase family 43, five-bladed beta-propellor domain protein n=1 Tax=Moelleriella libera RCEF 2490 TaxID=1081109 RepID=A0A168AU73_9HYPO|nr:Glycosyl hydrolase family 43, five-bladed beta-propellor domain protein [Moelleriella libera RCEF 2490]
MTFSRYRPTSHFIAPHSWSNDPCGAVYVPESQEYLLCYQWNPGTTTGGNCAWGMAKSKDLVTWQDCMPAIWNGSSYDSQGVFSGSIVSRLVDGKRVLYLFYTSVSATPIHWSKPYIKGCESQSVAISTDYGKTWTRHDNNPLLESPPKAAATTGWRDPFVSRSTSLSDLLRVSHDTDYMMLSSGERSRGPQLHLYRSNDLHSWGFVSTVLDVGLRDKISAHSTRVWGINFECASFFTLGETDYILVGIEETEESSRHASRYILWLGGKFVSNGQGLPTFQIKSHNMLDHGMLYAAHLFRDAQNRLVQLGWADETAKQHIVQAQGWAGCLGHPRELVELARPLDAHAQIGAEWQVDEAAGTMRTLGIRPAQQVDMLRAGTTVSGSLSLDDFDGIRSQTFECKATFTGLRGNERLVFNVLQSPDSSEVTRLIFELARQEVVVDRSKSSLKQLGTVSPDRGHLGLLRGEDLDIRIFVDVSIIEIFANDRFALTSRVYPSLDTANKVSHDFGDYDQDKMSFEYWQTMKKAWPERDSGCGILPELLPKTGHEKSEVMATEMHVEVVAIS